MTAAVLSAGPKYRHLSRVRLAEAGWTHTELDASTDEYRRNGETVVLHHAANDVLTRASFSDGTVIDSGSLKIERTLGRMTGDPVQPWHAEDVVIDTDRPTLASVRDRLAGLLADVDDLLR